MRKKVAVVGAGNVGASCAQYIAEQNLADVVLVDIVEGVPMGKGLDLTQAGPIRGYDVSVTGTNDYGLIKGSALIIITAGLPRKPGMTREDLITMNAEIVSKVVYEIKKYAAEAFILVVTNPLDIMTYHAWKKSGLPSNCVFGQAGVLDSIRFRMFVAAELGVSMQDTQALVLGGHGDTMVPLPRYTTVGGIPITELLPKEKIEALSKRTQEGGTEIVALLKTGSAYYAPAAASVAMAEAVLTDRKRVFACSAYCTGQYGISDLYIGVPVILGAGGVEKIIELQLQPDELALLQKSAATYKGMLQVLKY